MKQFSNQDFDESVNLRDLLEKYLIHYKWFLASVVLLFLLAILYVRYTSPKYDVNATILIKEMDKESSFDKLSSIEEIGMFGISTNSLENEIQILKSRNLISNVVKELNLNYIYFLEDSPYDLELYPDYPFSVNLLADSTHTGHVNTDFQVLIKSEKSFDFIALDGEVMEGKSFNQPFQANLGNKEYDDLRKVIFDRNINFNKELIGRTIHVKILPFENVVDQYMKKLTIEPVNEKMSNVIAISLTEGVRAKGIAIVNNLIAQFNADGINDKNLIAKATTDFLDDRLVLISSELAAIEGSAAQFKTNKGMIDANTEATYFLQSSTLTEGQIVGANTQLQLVNYMQNELNKSSLSDLLPSNIGLADPGIIGLISEYNDLVLQRNRVLKSSSTKNPIIQNIDSQLQILRNNLQGSLNNLKSSSEIEINALNRRSGSISSKIASAPKFESEYKDIVREQETKNTLYMFLLQKREESILANAVQVDKAKVIDPAFSSVQPVSPKKTLIYAASILLGLLLPVAIIYLKHLLDTKVHDEQDIKNLSLPFLGDIPYSGSKKHLLISDHDNSDIAESFRYLRTNINFMLDAKDLGKTVLVTSTLSGEGKSVTAINLARSLSLSGKKTLLLGMDLRSPKFYEYLNVEKGPGVTNFIKDAGLKVEDILHSYPGFENLSIISSGEIPPNPVELLMSIRVSALFEELKAKFEYIIVDTAPVGLVTDTVQISKFADLTIYVIKANSLDKRMLHIPEKLHREEKLPNMALLINASDHSRGSYGYGYGYGYGNKKKVNWYRKIFKS